MDISVYGITPEFTAMFLCLGISIGLFWESIPKAKIYSSSIPSGRIVVFISLLFILIFGSYLILGSVLTSFIYSIVGIGIILELVCTRVGEVALVLFAQFSLQRKQKVANSSNAMLHTLLEELIP